MIEVQNSAVRGVQSKIEQKLKFTKVKNTMIKKNLKMKIHTHLSALFLGSAVCFSALKRIRGLVLQPLCYSGVLLTIYKQVTVIVKKKYLYWKHKQVWVTHPEVVITSLGWLIRTLLLRAEIIRQRMRKYVLLTNMFFNCSIVFYGYNNGFYFC